MFKEILTFSKIHFENERKTYHISAKLEEVPDSKDLSNSQLLELFDDNSARQVLHVTFGIVLTIKENGNYVFRNRILNCLEQNEEAHFKNIIKHFARHLEPLVPSV